MSLLDNGPHQLAVLDQTPRVTAHGTALSPVPGVPPRIRGTLQPSSATDDRTQGLREVTTRRWISRAFPPASQYARVVSIGGEFHGWLWELDGAGQFFGTGRRTRHWEVQLRKLRVVPEDELEVMLRGEPGP